MDKFSKRLGYQSGASKITIREDAPVALRYFIPECYYRIGYEPSNARNIICPILREVPDRNNWTERPNIATEVENLLENCAWFKVYDILEALAQSIQQRPRYEEFEAEINAFFEETGIGWKLEGRLINYRGEEAFESAIHAAVETLEAAQLNTANNEIKESVRDISRRPEPEITGAVQHALAGLECVAREVTGDKKATLGQLIKANNGILPKPLDQVVAQLYGFASEQGRHLREGGAPNFEEAELLVGLSASLATYLAKKLQVPQP